MKSAGCKHLSYFFIVVILVLSGAIVSHGMEITISMPTGQTLTINAEPGQTVLEVKTVVYNITEIHPHNQRMFKGNAELDNEMTLSTYVISEGENLVVRYGKSGGSVKKRSTGKIVLLFIGFTVLAAVVYGIKKILADPTEPPERTGSKRK